MPLILLAMFVSSGAAAQPRQDLTLHQLNHRVFTASHGLPSDVYALAQTTDGTLWIGGRAGLTRFDGIRFAPYPGPADESLPSTNISSLMATPEGGLWIGFRLGGVAFLKDNQLTRYETSGRPPDSTVEQFAMERDGSVWAAARLGLHRLRNGQWQKITEEADIGSPYGVLVDRAGTLWASTTTGLFARSASEQRFRQVDGTPGYGRGGALFAASDGNIWAAPATGLSRVDRSIDPHARGAVTVRGLAGEPLLIDYLGNLWGWDPVAQSLLHVPASELNYDGKQDITVYPEQYSLADGISATKINAVLEDRERNVWILSTSSLHRFSHSNVVRDTTPPCLALGSSTGPAIAAGDAGALWVACEEGSRSLVEMRDGAVLRWESAPLFSAAHRDPQGIIWFGGPDALGRLERGRLVTSPLPPFLKGRPVQALVRDNEGALWVSVSRRSTYRFLDGKWSEYGGLDALPRGFALVSTADHKGVMWFGYSGNRIARVAGKRVQLLDSQQGLAVGNVLSILPHGEAIWVGGELGFARFDGTRFIPVRSASEASFKGVSGIVQTRRGDLWLNGIGGIVHIAQAEVERFLGDPEHAVANKTFDALDGVAGMASQLRPQPSAIETTDGRIWFSMTGGLISIDATQLVRNDLPPPVTIWSVTSGSTRYPNRRAGIKLPVHTNDLQIEYSAGSLTVPERVQFRYQLEGSDRDWQDVGTRREASYTNLHPGRYTFRVQAANNDGVWNRTGTSIDFTIAPAFYQTWWFYALCGLAWVAIVTALYRVRVRQVAAQVRGRLEARLAERERIARELHDTLLQGMQGLIWRFQAATDRIPADEPARQLMEQSLDRADKLLGESRDKVKDLRPAPGSVVDLAEALAAEGEQLAQLRPAKFRVSVQGTCRALHPIVREEGFLIGREALTNAFRHAEAQTIEAEVTYGDSALHMRFRDDGQGIEAAVLDVGGRPGHFGLIGMRERAKKLGARLEVWSKPGAGTEIDLRVPAKVAYEQTQTARHGLHSRLAL